MLLSFVWIRHFARRQDVLLQVELVRDDQLVGLGSRQLTDLLQAGVHLEARRQYQGREPGRTPRECERCGGDVHFPIAYKNVPVAPEPAEALVEVNILVVAVEKITVDE